MKRLSSIASLLLLFLAVEAFAAARSVVVYDGSGDSYFDYCDYGWRVNDYQTTFEYREFNYDPELRAIDYRVKLKEGARKDWWGLLYYRPEGLPMSQRLVLRIRNLGTEPFEFYAYYRISYERAAGVRGMHSWGFKRCNRVPADGKWHDISFEITPDNIVGDGTEISPVPLFGIPGKLEFHVPAPDPGVEQHYQIAEIRCEDDVASTGTIQWNAEFPKTMTAGTTLAIPGFKVDFQGRLPLDQETRLVLSPLFKGTDWPKLRIPFGKAVVEGEAWRLDETTVDLTPFLLDGEYEARIECGESVLENALFKVHVSGRKDVSFHKMRLMEYGGRPTIMKDGDPVPGIMRATYTPMGSKGVTAFTEAGIDLFGFCETPTEGGYELEMLCEYAPGKYNYSMLDRRMRNVLSINPEAMLVIRLYLSAPRWWMRDNPDELVRVGLHDDPANRLELFKTLQGRAVASWSSRKWREYTEEGLRNMMKYLAESPYADHIAGFVLASGTTEEWMEWGFNENLIPDYAPCAEIAFREWLRGKYGSDKALQKAWNDENATLATAAIPTPYQRSKNMYLGFYGPENPGARQIADYNRFHAETTSECIEEFCKTIKEATDGKLLAGAFYGYMTELASPARSVILSSHLGVGRILASPFVDYLCSPTGYGYRMVGGEGMSYAMGAADSLQLHNKFWFIENDIRTSAMHPDVGYGRPENVEGDILQQTKESMHNLLTGMAQWWFDVGYIDFSDSEVMRWIGKCVKIMKEITLEHSREPAAQVAIVMDEASIDWLTFGSNMVGAVTRSLQRTISNLGTPYEVYLTQDLPILPERIKLVVLPLSLQWTQEQLQGIEMLKNEGKTFLFLGTPGAIPPEGTDMSQDESIRKFTGMPLRFKTLKTTPECIVDTPDNEWVNAEEYGNIYNVTAWSDKPEGSLIAYIPEDTDVKVIARYIDKSKNKRLPLGAIGVSETPVSTTIFSGVVELPLQVWDSIYKRAGVHQYIDTPDQVWATKDAFAVCVKKGGARIITLPRRCTRIRELFSGETFEVDNENKTSVIFKPLETKVFLME